MAHFIIEYRELGNPEGRETLRPEHIEYRKRLGAALPLAGPLLDEHERPVGSIMILEADGPREAEATALGDPYVKGQVVELVSVRRYRIAAIKAPSS